MFVGIGIPSIVISFTLFCGLPEIIFKKMPCYKEKEAGSDAAVATGVTTSVVELKEVAKVDPSIDEKVDPEIAENNQI